MFKSTQTHVRTDRQTGKQTTFVVNVSAGCPIKMKICYKIDEMENNVVCTAYVSKLIKSITIHHLGKKSLVIINSLSIDKKI